jgi:hypothetical protein
MGDEGGPLGIGLPMQSSLSVSIRNKMVIDI